MGVNGIYGLSGSGLDIESMVKVGMMSKQSQYDKMQQQYTKNEWKKTELVNIYSTLQTFNNSTLSQYKMSNNMDAHSAESSNSAIKVTANASAPIMRHNVSVEETATNAYLIGTNSLQRIGEDSASTSTQLKDVLFKSVTAAGDNVTYKDASGNTNIANKEDVAFSFSVGDGVNGGITSTNPDAVTAKVADVSAATSGEYTVDVTQLAEGVTLSGSAANMTRYGSDSTSTKLQDLLFSNLTIENSKVTSYTGIAGNGGSDSLSSAGTAVGFTLSDGTNDATISVSYNKIAAGYTLEDLASAINDAGLNINANFDTDTQEFSLVHSETGSSSQISIKTTYNNNGTKNYAGDTTAAFLNALGLNDGTSTLNFTANTTTASASGKDAQLTVNGTAVTSATNEYTQDGITFSLKDTDTSTVKVDTAAIEKNTISVTYGELADGYTFNDLTSAVNGLGQNARMTYDSVNDKFSLYNKDTGESNTIAIAIADSSSGGTAAAKFFNDIGLKQSTNGELSASAIDFTAGEVSVATGSNASVKIDGVSYDLSDNKTTVNGVTYDFTNATAGATSVVSVDQDKDKIVEYVKGFIKDYNELLSTLYKAYDEKPNSNYKPLTDSQKDNMTKEQIEKWEEKAKAGMLYHDQTLGKVIDELRSAVSTKIDGVAGKYDSIFSIGISTTGLKGQLTLDEDKLTAALNDDSESVYNVFAKLEYNNDATSASGKIQQAADNFSKSGIAQRIGDIMTSSMKSVKTVAGSSSSITEDSDLNNLLRELQTKMSNFKSMMNAFENKLYKKYDAMETMLAGLGVQLNYVTSAFA